MLDSLVSFATVSKDSNLELIYFVKNYLTSLGLKANIIYNENKTKANLYTQIGPSVPGGVILSGHTDVVPTTGQEWKTKPYKLTKNEHRLYGRGTCDMKGFNAVILASIPRMLKAELKRPIQIALSYDEEIGCKGAPHMIEEMRQNLPHAAYVIVGEPTQMKVVTGHKASLGFSTTIRGFEVHSSLMHKGVSAIMTAGKILNWINQQNKKNSDKDKSDTDLLFDPPYTTLHVGLIKGGSATNITSRNCHFSLDIRCLPSEKPKRWIKKYTTFCAKLEKEIKAVNRQAKITIEQNHLVPALLPEQDGIAEALARKLTGDNGFNAVSYGTEAGQFQRAGYSTIICGPGSINQAHQENEFIELSELKKSEAFINKIISQMSN